MTHPNTPPFTPVLSTEDALALLAPGTEFVQVLRVRGTRYVVTSFVGDSMECELWTIARARQAIMENRAILADPCMARRGYALAVMDPYGWVYMETWTAPPEPEPEPNTPQAQDRPWPQGALCMVDDGSVVCEVVVDHTAEGLPDTRMVEPLYQNPTQLRRDTRHVSRLKAPGPGDISAALNAEHDLLRAAERRHDAMSIRLYRALVEATAGAGGDCG